MPACFANSKSVRVRNAAGQRRVGPFHGPGLGSGPISLYSWSRGGKQNKIFLWFNSKGHIKIFILFFFPPLLCNLSGCGLPLLGDFKQLLETQASGFAFLFLLFHRVPGPPFSEDLCSCSRLELYGSMVVLNHPNATSYSNLIAHVGGVPM